VSTGGRRKTAGEGAARTVFRSPQSSVLSETSCPSSVSCCVFKGWWVGVGYKQSTSRETKPFLSFGTCYCALRFWDWQVQPTRSGGGSNAQSKASRREAAAVTPQAGRQDGAVVTRVRRKQEIDLSVNCADGYNSFTMIVYRDAVLSASRVGHDLILICFDMSESRLLLYLVLSGVCSLLD